MLKFTAPITIDAAAPDGAPKRTITGIAVPYGVSATVTDGTEVRFEKGALPTEGKAPKLFLYHDATQPVGLVTERVDTEEGMLFSAKIAATAAGDEALTLAMEGVLDSVSVGVNPTKYKYDKDGVMVITAADWLELSMVPVPAFAGAAITDVAAAAQEIHTETPDVAIVTDEATPKEIEVSESPAVIEASSVAPVLFAQPKQFKLPSAAEYLAKIMAGGSEAADFVANIRAAAPDVLTTDTPGILPEPILGPVYNNFRGLRPVVDAVGVKAMPGGGKVFRRPEVTTHTTIGASNGENAALDSGTFVVSNNNVTKGVYGGFVKLSEEDMDWTEPEVVGLLLDDMARIYANETDNVAADNLLTGTNLGVNIAAADIAKPEEWVKTVYLCAEAILKGSNGNLPTHLFLAANMWRALGLLVDDQNRPLFPQVGPMNAFGTMSPASVGATAFGLTVVVDRNFADDTVIVADPSGYEIFEQQKGAVQVDTADGSLSRIIKFRGYFATLMIDNQKFRKFSWT
jgi:HK97 family phage prohead protease